MKSHKTRFIPGMLAALLGFAATPSFALPTSEVEVVYFKDATFTREVGSVFRGCQGEVYRQGTTSRYCLLCRRKTDDLSREPLRLVAVRLPISVRRPRGESA
jgi:hypothetical protein